MKHVSILVPHGHTSLVNIEGTHQILSEVNGLLRERGEDPLFDIHLVGLARHTRQSTGLFTVNPDALCDEVAKTDLIIVPAIHGDPKEAVERNRDFLPWIVERHREGAEVASFCIGAYFLAATGLLDGRQCATHWMHTAALRKMFPEILVVDEKIMTEDKGIYTSGGAYSYLNLLLYIVEKHAGREISVLIAKVFKIDMDRSSQSPFFFFRGQREHDDELIKTVQDYIEEHFDERTTVDSLASLATLGRRSLERRFRKAMGNSIAEYLQRTKIEAAKRRLEAGSESIFEVMYGVGYSDIKAFRSVFKKTTGITPLDYRKKYGKAATA